MSNILKTIRLGRLIVGATRPRPLLLKLDNPGDKWRLLKNIRNLNTRDDRMKKVNITLDMTREERKANNRLVEELKGRRTNWVTQTDIYIYIYIYIKR